MAATPGSDLPLDLGFGGSAARSQRRWFDKRYLLVLLVPVFMFLGGVLGMYFQPVPIQKFYEFTGLQLGAGSDSPIALPPNVVLPEKMPRQCCPPTSWGSLV